MTSSNVQKCSDIGHFSWWTAHDLSSFTSQRQCPEDWACNNAIEKAPCIFTVRDRGFFCCTITGFFYVAFGRRRPQGNWYNVQEGSVHQVVEPVISKPDHGVVLLELQLGD